MPPRFNTCRAIVGGVAASILILGGTMQRADAQKAQTVTLSCEDAALCASLNRALGNYAPGVQVVATDAALVLRLEVERMTDDHLSAHLEWQSPGDAGMTAGPTVRIDAMDTTLSNVTFDRYFYDMLRISQAPL